MISTNGLVSNSLKLEPSLEITGLSATYNPWASVGFFNRACIGMLRDPAGCCQLDPRSSVPLAGCFEADRPNHFK